MDINIYVNQKKINPLCSKAIAEYVKRLSPYCTMKVVCAPGHIKYSPGHSSMHFTVFPADSQSSTISSEEFARQINTVTSGGISKLNYYIGYTSEETAGITDMEAFSICTISPSTEMTALLLSEQIYRAYTILNNITYHK